MRTAVYSFTLLCVAYGLVEASFWAYFPIALFGGGLVAFFGGVPWAEKLFFVLTLIVWLVLVIGLVGKVMLYLGRALRQTFREGTPSEFHSWRYALAITAIVIVAFAVLPSWLGLLMSDLPWFGSRTLSFTGRLTSVLLAIAALPNQRHALRQPTRVQ
jgi:hypothetical protein